ncbi:hypothetical protein CW711_00915 [Candidatus Bathyarchaeota archaeon]|nr:MAG: hypothetical protein CW711_00915 [Candidatus Bathyarchaeota archaeon]RLG96208.1 MAG: hypothetical protein DRO29_05030 [Candidatus Bathyarchaeota archaeon]
MILIEYWFRNTEELTRFVESIDSRGLPRVCPAIVLEKIK